MWDMVWVLREQYVKLLNVKCDHDSFKRATLERFDAPDL
jgi:hypothetical protein